MINGVAVRKDIERFLTDTSDARTLSEKCRDYYNGNQWTEDEAKTVEKRGQAAIVVNKTKPKVEGLVGLYDIRKSEPKAFPRTLKHEDAGHVVTDGLRYVTQNNDFDEIRGDVATDFFVEGYGGAIVKTVERKGEIEIRIEQIPWDRIYFDPHSRRNDFKDARYMGVIMWMSMEQAENMFPGKKKTIRALENDHTGFEDQTFEDRPRFVDRERNRIRVAMHFEFHKQVWHYLVIVGDTFLVSPQPSPFLDEDGDPTNPIELVSAYVGRDNERFGETKHMLDLQDEINHRRSKFLHFMNSRQTFGRKGDAGDVARMKRELQKPNGHVEFEGEVFGKDFGIIPSSGSEQGQFEMYLDSKQEMAATAFQANLEEANREQSLSGRAIARLQQADTIEVNRQYGRLKGWELRIYRQIWARQKQFWDRERWIRVTDDEDSVRWVGFNAPITVQQELEEKINDESQPFFVRRRAAEIFTAMVQAQDPRLQEIIEVRNPIPELDMDLILDQSFDVVNMQEEQFQMLAQFGANSGVDLLDLIEVSNLRGKDQLIEKIEKRRQEQAQAQGSAIQLESQEKQARTENIQADTTKKFVEAQQKQVETENLIQNPDPRPQAVI